MKKKPWLAIAGLVAVAFSLPGCQPSSAPPQDAPPLSAQRALAPVPVLPPTPARTKIELSEATTRGLVQITGSGDGLESINTSIQSKSATPLEVTIPVGTIFKASSRDTQSMVTTETETVALDSRGETRSIRIDAACATMYRETPGERDSFTVANTPASDDLKRLLTLPEVGRKDFRVQQFAIWTITDNPGRDEYVGVGQFEFSNGPDKDEIKRIRTLFEKAGISTRKYRALR